MHRDSLTLLASMTECRRHLETLRQVGLAISGRFRAFDDPGLGAIPGMIFLTGGATHTHFNVWKCIKNHSSGVKASGNRSARSRTSNEYVASHASSLCRQDRFK